MTYEIEYKSQYTKKWVALPFDFLSKKKAKRFAEAYFLRHQKLYRIVKITRKQIGEIYSAHITRGMREQ